MASGGTELPVATNGTDLPANVSANCAKNPALVYTCDDLHKIYNVTGCSYCIIIYSFRWKPLNCV